jgi:DNA-binding NarL/FixJ family response regulator
MSSLALIAAPPDTLRRSLQALLAGLPQIATVKSVEDTTALEAILTAEQPRLIVLDVNLPSKATEAVLAQIAALTPHTRRVVLVDDAIQQQALQTAPADLVVVKGFPAAELYALFDQLLTQKS